MFLGISYNVWWFLVFGAVISGYAILDGFDLGAGSLHLFLKDDKSRRLALKAIGPVWDGNEVWLVIGGGALFAGFPVAYAAIFSAFYIPFIVFMMAIIMRAISIEFRSKETWLWWRKTWDITYTVANILMALCMGVLLGNIAEGVTLDSQHDFMGSWLSFVNPFALLIGLTTLSLFMMHGSLFLIMKTGGLLHEQLRGMSKKCTWIFVFFFVLSTLYTFLYLPHLTFRLRQYPLLAVLPVVMILSILAIPRSLHLKKYRQAFLFSALTIACLLISVAVELFPYLVYSTGAPLNSLTVDNSASSFKTMQIMLLIVLIGVPLFAIYTIFVFWTFKGRVDEESEDTVIESSY